MGSNYTAGSGRGNGMARKMAVKRAIWQLAVACLGIAVAVSCSAAAGMQVFGRTGDAIAVDLAKLTGAGSGATFSSLNLTGFTGHTVLTSDTLGGGTFAATGKLWVFANPARNTRATGDTDVSERGFQGTLTGSVLVNGVSQSFNVTVRPGYTGSGAGAVGQSAERINRAANNPLFVAQQQQRLRYFSFVRDGATAVPVNGVFDTATDEATRTFQAAFLGGVNTTQDDADGIIGPISAGWLNAVNAPTWEKLIDPDPQTPGSFSVGGAIGNFDILPGRDPGTNARTGLTPQPEQHATSWTIDLIQKGSAKAKLATGRTQIINALSYDDGYGSLCCHSTHTVGMDIDLNTNTATWNNGNGVVDSEEQKVISHAIAFMTAGASGRVSRIITSNDDILDGINAFRAGAAVYDSTNVHINHLHIDVGVPTQIVGLANLAGDFNLDDVVDASDYTVWRDGMGALYTAADYTTWKSNFGNARAGSGGSALVGAAVPEPVSLAIALATAAVCVNLRRRRRSVGENSCNSRGRAIA